MGMHVCTLKVKRKGKWKIWERKWGFEVKPKFSEIIDLLPAASGDGFALVRAWMSKQGVVPLGGKNLKFVATKAQAPAFG